MFLFINKCLFAFEMKYQFRRIEITPRLDNNLKWSTIFACSCLFFTLLHIRLHRTLLSYKNFLSHFQGTAKWCIPNNRFNNQPLVNHHTIDSTSFLNETIKVKKFSHIFNDSLFFYLFVFIRCQSKKCLRFFVYLDF